MDFCFCRGGGGEGRRRGKDFKQNGLLIDTPQQNPCVVASFDVPLDRRPFLIHLRNECRVWMYSLHPSILSAFSPPPVCFDQHLWRRGGLVALIFLAAALGCEPLITPGDALPP